MHIAGSEGGDATGAFAFEEVNFAPKILEDGQQKDLWGKWGLDQNSYMKRLSFDEFFSKEQKDVFIRDLFASDAARKVLAVASGRNSWGSVGRLDSFTATELKATVTNLEFFSKINDLEDPAVVRGDKGAITKCFDEFVDGLAISDELRKLLVMEDSDHFEVFSESERREFIFHLFRRICIGGGMCQYEDEITPYLDTTKMLYKDFVGVQKNPSTKALEVTSVVYQLEEAEGQWGKLFPDRASRDHSFCYLIVEPDKRRVTVWYMAHMPMF